MALDQNYFPVGMPAFLVSEQPLIEDGKVVDWRPLRRFVVNQDSGSAIKGPGRVDLFWGCGLEAEGAAGVMKQPGELYFFVKK